MNTEEIQSRDSRSSVKYSPERFLSCVNPEMFSKQGCILTHFATDVTLERLLLPSMHQDMLLQVMAAGQPQLTQRALKPLQ